MIRIMRQNKAGYLFGHYDSRGGATLIVAKRLSMAAKKYEEAFGMNDFEEEDYNSDPAGEDLISYGQVWIEGEGEPDDNDELLPSYTGEDGWAVLQVTSHDQWRTEGGEWREETKTECGFLLVRDTVERHHGDEDPEPLTREWGHKNQDNFRTWLTAVELQELGEDAFGCLFQEV